MKKRVDVDAPLPPAPLVSKAILFDLKAKCDGCFTEKFIHAPTKLCFACHVLKEVDGAFS